MRYAISLNGVEQGAQQGALMLAEQVGNPGLVHGHVADHGMQLIGCPAAVRLLFSCCSADSGSHQRFHTNILFIAASTKGFRRVAYGDFFVL